MASPVAGWIFGIDASDAASITSSLGAVSQWNDNSGNLRHLTQATGANQPTTGTRTLNGLNVIAFDGGNDFMSTGAFTRNQPFTVFVVYQNDSGANSTQQRLIDGTTSGAVFQKNATNGWESFEGTSLVSTRPVDTRPHIGVSAVNNTSSTVRVDGIATAGTAGATNPAGGLRVGANAIPANFWNGVVAEVIWYSGILSDGDIARVEQYLAQKWGVPLPATEPLPAFQFVGIQPMLGIQLPLLGPSLFKNTNLIFGTSTNTLDAFTATAQGAVAAQRLTQLQPFLPYHPVEGINLPELGPRLFKNTNPIFGTVAQTLGSFAAAGAGSATSPRLPQLELLFQPLRGLQPAGLTFFTPQPVAVATVTGSSATTLDAFTATAQGSATAPQLPQIQALLLFPATTGAQAPIVGPALFPRPPATTATVTGTSATTLDAFTGSASGSVTSPAQPWVQAILLRPTPTGVQLPLFPARPPGAAGSESATLGAFTCSASGGTGPVGTLAVTLANAIADASGSSVVGTVAAVLAAFTCIATGSSTPTILTDPTPYETTYELDGQRGYVLAAANSHQLDAREAYRLAALRARPLDGRRAYRRRP